MSIRKRCFFIASEVEEMENPCRLDVLYRRKGGGK
nr:MAG TPA: hypothetical protein [Caudoviricetes sp.]DAU59654.1 MAG TPA: hypothetical protein [Caudoviricetes sp.]DAV41650.1 MAG TPA: hypothetical protein [Caudoviricetes sp.]